MLLIMRACDQVMHFLKHMYLHVLQSYLIYTQSNIQISCLFSRLLAV